MEHIRTNFGKYISDITDRLLPTRKRKDNTLAGVCVWGVCVCVCVVWVCVRVVCVWGVSVVCLGVGVGGGLNHYCSLRLTLSLKIIGLLPSFVEDHESTGHQSCECQTPTHSDRNSYPEHGIWSRRTRNKIKVLIMRIFYFILKCQKFFQAFPKHLCKKDSNKKQM